MIFFVEVCYLQMRYWNQDSHYHPTLSPLFHKKYLQRHKTSNWDNFKKFVHIIFSVRRVAFHIFWSKYNFLHLVIYFMSIPLFLISLYLFLWEEFFFNYIQFNMVRSVTILIYFVRTYLLNAMILSIQICYVQKLHIFHIFVYCNWAKWS